MVLFPINGYQLRQSMANQESSSQPDTPDQEAINRLLSAAVINRRYCELLLSQPAEALAVGFRGEIFQFSQAKHNLILSHQAQSLPALALLLSSH